jgi:hypothetical protein
MNQTFQSAASGSLSASAFTASKLYARSSNAADTGTLSASGLDESSVAVSESLTLAGQREVLGTEDFTVASALALSASQAGTVTVYREGTKATGLCYLTAQPSDGDTVTIGLTGFTQTYTFKTTLSTGPAVANEVFIGATANDTATNLKKAINDEGTEATHYGTGTAINPYVTATVSGAILTLTDKIGCSRSLAWACAKSGTNINIANPTGGVDGTLLGTIYTGTTAVYQAISLDDEALTLGGLPGLVNWTSDAVRVSGKAFSLHLVASNVATAMAASYEYSTESGTPTTWRAGLSSITNLDNNSQVITPTEHVEHVRLKINNTNSAAASVNAKILAP